MIRKPSFGRCKVEYITLISICKVFFKIFYICADSRGHIYCIEELSSKDKTPLFRVVPSASTGEPRTTGRGHYINCLIGKNFIKRFKRVNVCAVNHNFKMQMFVIGGFARHNTERADFVTCTHAVTDAYG